MDKNELENKLKDIQNLFDNSMKECGNFIDNTKDRSGKYHSILALHSLGLAIYRQNQIMIDYLDKLSNNE